MARLTKKQRAALEKTLDELNRGLAYIARKDIAVGLLDTPATTSMHFTRQDGSTFYSINKEAGSDLVFLQTGARRLESFLGSVDG